MKLDHQWYQRKILIIPTVITCMPALKTRETLAQNVQLKNWAASQVILKT